MRKRSGRPPRFAAVPNEAVDDALNLDFMALALLTVLLRHRDGWDITLANIGKRYGYGEDAMAGAMGLLQVARYVVKVRIMGEGNLWSTEVAVYDAPATDDDVAELLGVIREELPEARRVEAIPPTKTALERAGKRKKKLGAPIPRVRENPDSGATRENVAKPQVGPDSGVSRDSGDPGVSKKTVVKKTNKKTLALPDAVGQSAGGFASAGGREAAADESPQGDGGCAASGKTIPTQKSSAIPQHGTIKTAERRMPDGYDTVRAAVPAQVARPDTQLYVGLRRAIASLLRGNREAGIPARTPEQVIARMNRCWYGGLGPERSAFGYTPATDAEGDAPIRNRSSWLAAALLVQDCPDPACEDGVLIGAGRECSNCRERRAQRQQAREAAARLSRQLALDTAAAEQDRDQEDAAHRAYEHQAVREESTARQQLTATGAWGDLLEHRLSQHMANWRDQHPSPALASTGSPAPF